MLTLSHGQVNAQDGFANPGFDAPVSTFLLQPDGKILVAGGFDIAGSESHSKVVRLNSNGTPDPSFKDPLIFGEPSNSFVTSMVLQPDGKIVVVGFFTSIGGAAQRYLARLNTDGSVDPNFIPSLDRLATSIALQPDGKIVIGGEFSTVNGQTRSSIARLNSDGSLNSTFQDADVNASLNALALQPDGKVLVGGSFTSAGGQPKNYVARLNSNGSLDADFKLTVNGPVTQFVIQPDSKILLCGFFNVVDGVNRHVIVRINLDGTVDPTFPDSQILSGTVTRMALQADGKIVIGGAFSEIGGIERHDLARLTANGAYDASFQDVNANFGGTFYSINSILIQPDGKVLIGGQFSTIGHQTHNNAVRLLSDGTLDRPSSATVSGLVTSPNGSGLRNVTVTLRSSQGVQAVATTSSFGFYSFDSVPLNGVFSISVSSRLYRFPTRTFQVSGDLSGQDFVGLE